MHLASAILLALGHATATFTCLCCFKTLFRCKKFWDFDTVAFSFLFDKYCLIMEYLGLKDSSRDLQVNCAISFFYLYLILHACAVKFDVTENLVSFGFLAAKIHSLALGWRPPSLNLWHWSCHCTQSEMPPQAIPTRFVLPRPLRLLKADMNTPVRSKPMFFLKCFCLNTVAFLFLFDNYCLIIH